MKEFRKLVVNKIAIYLFVFVKIVTCTSIYVLMVNERVKLAISLFTFVTFLGWILIMLPWTCCFGRTIKRFLAKLFMHLAT